MIILWWNSFHFLEIEHKLLTLCKFSDHGSLTSIIRSFWDHCLGIYTRSSRIGWIYFMLGAFCFCWRVLLMSLLNPIYVDLKGSSLLMVLRATFFYFTLLASLSLTPEVFFLRECILICFSCLLIILGCYSTKSISSNSSILRSKT